MKIRITLVIALITIWCTNAQNVNIPDANFKKALLAHGVTITGDNISKIDTNNDKEIQVSEAEAYTGAIRVGNKEIENLTGIEAFVKLTRLSCYSNKLTSLDVSKNTALTQLNCSTNQLSSLNISKNTALVTLRCFVNKLSSLDVNVNTALTTLHCVNNQLTSLDLSKNTALTQLYCTYNKLTQLNVANGSTAKITTLNATGNSNLTCIQIDDNFTPPTNWEKDANATYNTNCGGTTAPIVNIPDANFKNALLAHGVTITGKKISKIDTNNDKEIQVSEAEAYTGIINVNSKGIKDLIGIEIFINLRELHCAGNKLSSLDVTANTKLTELFCNYSQLTSLDISKNTALRSLYCDYNQLTSLNISKNTALTTLICYHNQLTSLDVSTNKELGFLACSNNQLTSLDVSKNTALTNLSCESNQLTSLDISKNTALKYLECYENKLSSLDVSTNKSLQILSCESNQLTSLEVNESKGLRGLYCSNNQLTRLDVSETILTTLKCFSNQLTSLNIANGYNSIMTVMQAQNNPVLTCIKTDDGIIGTNPNGWQKDVGASYNENCFSVSTCTNIINIPDVNFKNALLAHGTKITGQGISKIDTDGDGEICQNEAQAYTGKINVFNTGVTDLTGIEAFTNLTVLNCFFNQLSNLDVSKNTKLRQLKCSFNQLTSLDVSKNTALTKLYCRKNKLTSLDVSKNTALTRLDCYTNQLSSLDVSINTKLTELNCYKNKLSSLDISKNSALKSLNCNSNQLTKLNIANGNNTKFTYFNATGNSNLTCIKIDANFTPPTNWKKDTTATYNINCATASVNNEIFSNELKIYPNPVTTNLNITAKANVITNISIYNVLGKKVITTKKTNINVTNLPKGIYLIKIHGTNSKIATKKFIKQ